jgi:hypothetical protein
MAEILAFTRPEYPFDIATAAALIEAYDKAIAGLHDSGQPASVRELIAQRIIALATKGERDPEVLWKAALLQLGIPR